MDEASASASSLLFTSRFGHDPLLDVPHDGRKNAKKEQFQPIRKSIRPVTLALLGVGRVLINHLALSAFGAKADNVCSF